MRCVGGHEELYVKSKTMQSVHCLEGKSTEVLKFQPYSVVERQCHSEWFDLKWFIEKLTNLEFFTVVGIETRLCDVCKTNIDILISIL